MGINKVTYLSPSARRMREFSSRIPLPSWHPNADPIGQAYFSRMAEMDIAFQQKIRRLNKLLPLLVLLRMKGGSGFRMASILRHFFLEYLNRLTQHGAYSFPTSFNVVESFLQFDNEFFIFDLRQEREHLLRLHDYFDWYTKDQGIPDDPKILIDIIEEGITHSYDVAGDTGEYTISGEGSRLAIAGLSMIRHENELSVILFAGENPPYPPDKDILAMSFSNGARPKGHEGISPAQDLSIRDRYISGMQGFSKVILLTRIDLVTKKHDVRYLNVDTGPSYMVFTDDIEALKESPGIEVSKEIIDNSLNGLERYKQLFSALTSLIYLPVMFIAEQTRIVDSRFITELGISSQNYHVRQAAKEFGRKALTIHRTIRCLTSANTDNLIVPGHRVIDPPDFKFESTGFWKAIGSDEIGEDKHGNPIVGKTWVERIESCSVKSPESFVIHNKPRISMGKDPGTVYIMRSSAHGNDLYKVGLTRGSTRERAVEIGSATAVPLPFEVLASWDVADCGNVEKEVHKHLQPYRVSKRREFFQTSLSSIVAAIEQVIASLEGSS
jgi:hypothetical protein